MKLEYERVLSTSILMTAQSTILRLWNQPGCPQTWLEKKIWHIDYMGYYSAIKRNILCLCQNGMQLEIVMLSEISQSNKGRCHIFHWSMIQRIQKDVIYMSKIDLWKFSSCLSLLSMLLRNSRVFNRFAFCLIIFPKEC